MNPPQRGPIMGTFHPTNNTTTGLSKIIARRQTPPKAMRRILGGISHQSAMVSPERTKRVLFSGKEKSKARDPSSSPNGGFFSHPAFKAPARRLHLSPAKASLGGVRGLKKRGSVGMDKGKKTAKDQSRKTTPRLGSSDDEREKVASSSTAHPSSDLGLLDDTFPDDEEHKRHFQAVVASLPPSSPPVFSHDLDAESDASSPIHPASNCAPSSPLNVTHTAPDIYRKRKSPPAQATPPPRHQKPKVSARTLEGRDDLPLVRIQYDGTYPLVLGRSRRALTTEAQAEGLVIQIEPVETVLLRETAAHLVRSDGGKAKLAPLPRTASHASRAHVLVEVVPGSFDVADRIIFSVLATRYPAGGVVQFVRADEGETMRIEVDMYSCRAIVEWLAPMELRTTHATPAPLLSPTRDVDDALVELLQTPVVRKKSTPTPTVSAPVMVPEDPDSPARSIHSQMTYESEPEHEDEARPVVVGGDISREVKKEWLDAAHATADHQTVGPAPRATSTTSDLSSLGPAPVPTVPVDIDLKALVATSLVFSGSSAISAPDLVKAILDSQPSMKSHGREAVWSVWVENTLDSHPMFGRVDRKGKDASGKPLLPLFHYVPAEDYDRTRAAELGGLMRPLRGTQRGGGKAIDWRPVGGRRR
ncbi:hypothetical protein QFC20_004759 [Naganishia adeliensis]|uniref:Uncharacterized protein n=1 Tax=Naganishia adeliensis TaxID=92952 RepID=A0ACC2VWP9_9TREE|nr:hypothetical protein QFC20_004759 [Naganishia adeliensis]